MKTEKMICLVILTALIFSLAIFGLEQMDKKTEEIERQRSNLETEILLLEHENTQLREMLSILQGEQGELRRQMREWLQQWEVITLEVSAYAPLDLRAVENMCYSGDPTVTNSGAKVVPGITAAAGPDIPFGTKVYVEGAMRVVQDRGGRVQYSDAGLMQLDLCVETREEALDEIGRREVIAIIEKGECDQ